MDPESVPSISAGLERLLRDDGLRDHLRRKGPAQAAQYSWKKTVDLFVRALEKIERNIEALKTYERERIVSRQT